MNLFFEAGSRTVHSVMEQESSLETDEPHAAETNYSKTDITTCALAANSTGALKAKQDLDKILKTFHSIIPTRDHFLQQYTSPCWYMGLYVDKKNKHTLLYELKGLSEENATKLERDTLHIRPMATLACLPTVYFIGFPKSGSSQIYEMMIHNPALLPGLNKEPHWWSRHSRASGVHGKLAIIRYIVQYRDASKHIQHNPKALAVDASQSTIWDTRFSDHLCATPTLISSIVPQAKFIVVMRDPVSRLYSDFAYLCEDYWKRHHLETVPRDYLQHAAEIFHTSAETEIAYFRKCLQTAPLEVCTNLALSGKYTSHDCGRVRLGISLYYVHIARWLTVFPRNQFLFLNTDDLASDPYSLVQSIWTFLSVPSQSKEELQDVLYEHLFSNKLTHMKSLQMMDRTKNMLREFFEPYNQQLAELLGDKKFLWNG